jgi:hypothetical protein
MPKAGQALAASLIVVSACAWPASLASQEINPLVRERIAISERPAQPVRLQVSMNYFMPGPTDESEEANAIRDRARRAIYVFAANECEVAEQILAKSCRLEAINVNINRQGGGQQVAGFNVSGTITLMITPK